jgi:hypothetical protein
MKIFKKHNNNVKRGKIENIGLNKSNAKNRDPLCKNPEIVIHFLLIKVPNFGPR